MLQPLTRPAGSTQGLRYRGQCVAGEALATFPKTNGTFPTVIVPSDGIFRASLRLALFDPGSTSPPLDPAAFANPSRRLPGFVFDDGQLAGVSPHATLAAGVATDFDPGVNDDEIYIGNETWAQNVRIQWSPLRPIILQADIQPLTTETDDSFGSGGCFFVRDTLTSGLGLNTGLPVLILPLLVQGTPGSEGPGTAVPFYVDLTIEIRHTAHR